MFVRVLLTASIVLTGAIFACGNNLTGPEEELVGTDLEDCRWSYCQS